MLFAWWGWLHVCALVVLLYALDKEREEERVRRFVRRLAVERELHRAVGNLPKEFFEAGKKGGTC